MKYLNKSIEELHELIKSGQLNPNDLVKESLERAKELQPKLNGFVTFNDEVLNNDYSNINKDNPLAGIPFAIKDNFSTKGLLSTGSSNILKNYIPVYNATVVEKLAQAGAINIGKTVMDELALGGTGLNGHTGVVHNPRDLNRISGGSSAGSAVSVASGIVPFAIGSDTGDSVRKPAALNGIVGFKPTWGLISRFGLFPFAPSLDHVAFFTRTVKDSAYVLENLAGYDPKDMSSAPSSNIPYSKNLNSEIKGKKIAVIKEIDDSLLNESVKANFDSVVEAVKKAGAIVEEKSVDIKLLKAILPIYLVISCSEATSNDANLDGIKFGPREKGSTYVESIFNTRTTNISELVKRRFVIGSYCLSAANQEKLFLRAQRVRRLIVDEFNKIFDSYDVCLFPAAGDIAPLINGSSENVSKLSDKYLIGENHLAIGNFGGFPSITIPSGMVDSMPVGINITSKAFKDQEVLDVASGIEKVLGIKNQIVEEVK